MLRCYTINPRVQEVKLQKFKSAHYQYFQDTHVLSVTLALKKMKNMS